MTGLAEGEGGGRGEEKRDVNGGEVREGGGVKSGGDGVAGEGGVEEVKGGEVRGCEKEGMSV